jgi:hypothetical protein
MQPHPHKPRHAAPTESAQLTEEAAEDAAVDGYVFGYPLVLMEATRRVATAVPAPDRFRAPVNQFNDSVEFPDASFTDVVSPNVDTLYSIAWLDLSAEPIVLSLPDTGDRYYVMQMLDAWTNVFAAPGTRTTGNHAGDYAITGPGYRGDLPHGLSRIPSPTNMVWIIGRTQTNGRADYAAVRALKAQYRLIPLSAWGKPYVPPAEALVDPSIGSATSPPDHVAKMSAQEFFASLARLMKENPPAPEDAPMLARLGRIGVGPTAPFDPSRLAPGVEEAIERGVATARTQLAAGAQASFGESVNGWDVSMHLGRYGTDYAFRAGVALLGLGANLPEDAVYPLATVDAGGRSLTGSSRYRIHFEPGHLPPVDAFWSLTLYDEHQHLVANPIDRYALGDRDDLLFDADGGLTLYVQHESPGGELERNWLPAPEGSFNLALRLYQPRRAILEGRWQPPAVQPVQ